MAPSSVQWRTIKLRLKMSRYPLYSVWTSQHFSQPHPIPSPTSHIMFNIHPPPMFSHIKFETDLLFSFLCCCSNFYFLFVFKFICSVFFFFFFNKDDISSIVEAWEICIFCFSSTLFTWCHTFLQDGTLVCQSQVLITCLWKMIQLPQPYIEASY